MTYLSLHTAIEKLCQDTLEQSVSEVRERSDDGEITVALQTVIRALDSLARIRMAQPSMLETLRINNVVFRGPLGNDPANWEHVAFSIYTSLCEVDMWAREGLGALLEL